MSFMAALKLIASLLPELIALFKWANEKIEQGMELADIKKAISATTKAFDKVDSDPAQAAKELDEIFTGISFKHKSDKLQK
jgi:hypothetical protein